MEKIIVKGENYGGEAYEYDIVEKICMAMKHMRKDFNDKHLEYIENNLPDVFSKALDICERLSDDYHDLFHIAHEVLIKLEDEKVLKFEEKDLINTANNFEHVIINSLIIDLAVFKNSREFYKFIDELFPDEDWEIDVFENIPMSDDYYFDRDFTDLLFEYVRLPEDEKKIINILIDNGHSYLAYSYFHERKVETKIKGKNNV